MKRRDNMLPYTRLGNEKNWERAIERTKEKFHECRRS